MKQLTPLDSNFFFYETPNQPMMIGSVWLCDPTTAPGGLVRHKQILQYIDDRLSLSSLFRRRLQQSPWQLDDPYWLEDKNFNLEYHVRHVGLPQPGDWRQLCIFVARTMSRSVDMNRAPWEIYIIEGVNNVKGMPKGSFAVLLRFHHAYVDGKSSFTLATDMMENTPNHEFGANRGILEYERPPTEAEMWMRTLPRLIDQSFRAATAGIRLQMKSFELVRRLFSEQILDQTRVPKTIFNTTVSPHRTYGSYGWSLRDLKPVRQLSSGATINDVIIAIVAGAMRRYLQAHEALPESESLVSMVPVALRADDSKHEGGNLVSAIYIPIGTDIEDPVERLGVVQQRTRKHVPVAKEVLYDMTNDLGEMLPAYTRAWLAQMANRTHLASRVPLFNTVITNVPGVPGMEPLYFAGAKIQSVHPIVPPSDMTAITHGITGIYDFISVGVTADREVVPDMAFYIKCLKNSGQEYVDLAQKQLAEQAQAEAAASKPETAVEAQVGQGAAAPQAAPSGGEAEANSAPKAKKTGRAGGAGSSKSASRRAASSGGTKTGKAGAGKANDKTAGGNASNKAAPASRRKTGTNA